MEVGEEVEEEEGGEEDEGGREPDLPPFLSVMA